MKRETIVPKSESHWLELRKKNINSTDVAALFGVSPYLTPFELFNRLQGNIEDSFQETERTEWGNVLQWSIARKIGKDNKWKVRAMDEYIFLPEIGMGSSFDYRVGVDGILEVKNVDASVFRDTWSVDGDDIEAPPHIELQVQHQLAVSDLSYCYIGALVGGNRVVLVRREPDEKVIKSIFKKVEQFRDMLEKNKAPEPDFSRDYEIIRQLYRYASPGKIMDASNDRDLADLCAQYRDLGKQKSEAEKAQKSIKAQILEKIGDAEKVFGTGFSVNAKIISETLVESYTRESYRDFRVNWSKSKEIVK